MKKILFMIPDLSVGGAEKVLVNLVNNMDYLEFDISVLTLFSGGVNEMFLKPHIKLKSCFRRVFRGNSQIFKLFSPQKLFKIFIKEKYDIIVSYLEGPTARIVSGCTDVDTKLVSWIHIEQHTKKLASYSFRSYKEAKLCYEKYNNTVCVSKYVKEDFKNIFDFNGKLDVLYNTVETNKIINLSKESINDFILKSNEIKICSVGKLTKNKGCHKLVRILKRLRESNLDVHLFFLGIGPEEEYLRNYAETNGLTSYITLLGYQTNPYKYIKKCDLLVCSSSAEGFSTAATEALILGVPVCTVEVSGMKEMLGENNEYGIVTENSEDALYEGIKKMLTTPNMLDDYSKKALERGKMFSTEKTVKAVEEMLLSL